MKLTCIMIVALLFLTAWTFVTADDSINGPNNRQMWEKLLSKARDQMKNPEASKLNKKDCWPDGSLCGVNTVDCCNFCLIFCYSM
nr:TPA_inf: conotoxin precursor O1 [Conus ebraeus]